MAGRLEGKVAFITGLARGQGRAHAVRMAEEGADIIGVDLPEPYTHETTYPMASQADLDETIAQVEKLGRRIVARKGDVRDRETLAAAVDAGLAEFGKLDIVVANAGVCTLGPTPPVAFFESVDTDLVGVLNTLAVTHTHLKAGGVMLITGSTAAMIADSVDAPPPQGGVPSGGYGYTFAKSSIVKLGRQLSLLFAPENIRVNVIHPTNCGTDLLLNDAMYRQFRPDLENPTKEDAVLSFPAMQALPIPYVEPVDIANAAVFLASDEARYITGMQLRVDAGGAIKMVHDLV
jgi:SDR family mycofactocin-dependent oxidoreductase